MTKRYTREKFATRNEWLGKRGIGGSDAAAIVGKSPWKSALEVFNEFFYEPKAKTDTSAMAHGRALEPIVRKMYREKHPEYKVRDPKGYEMYRSKDYPLMTATVDGILTEIATGRKGVWECKTHEVRNFMDAQQWEGQWPVYYLLQVYHYLLVLNDCDFIELCVALDFYEYTGDERRLKKTEVRYEHIERSDIEEQLNWLFKQELAFINHVNNGVPPDGAIEL